MAVFKNHALKGGLNKLSLYHHLFIDAKEEINQLTHQFIISMSACSLFQEQSFIMRDQLKFLSCKLSYNQQLEYWSCGFIIH